jgi:hypothetical protein
MCFQLIIGGVEQRAFTELSSGKTSDAPSMKIFMAFL